MSLFSLVSGSAIWEVLTGALCDMATFVVGVEGSRVFAEYFLCV